MRAVELTVYNEIIGSNPPYKRVHVSFVSMQSYGNARFYVRKGRWNESRSHCRSVETSCLADSVVLDQSNAIVFIIFYTLGGVC